MLAILGASGNVGIATLDALLEYKLAAADTIVALTSSQPGSEKWKGLEAKGVRVRHASFKESASLEAALEGLAKLFLISSPNVEMDFNDAPEGQGREKSHIRP
ncbi:hypothetical protein ACJ41O_014467 [Fusarium nematophilum]